MQRILNFLQVKTIRSARVFLIGSGLLFVFGVYQLVMYPQILSEPATKHFQIIFFSFWFLVTATYVVIGYWALFTKKGKEHLKAQEKILIKGSRNIFWYFKFLFACYAAGLGTLIASDVLLLPFVGLSGIDGIFGSHKKGLFLLVSGLVWSPLIFRYLK